MGRFRGGRFVGRLGHVGPVGQWWQPKTSLSTGLSSIVLTKVEALAQVDAGKKKIFRGSKSPGYRSILTPGRVFSADVTARNKATSGIMQHNCQETYVPAVETLDSRISSG